MSTDAWTRMVLSLAAVGISSCGSDGKPSNAGTAAKIFASSTCKKDLVSNSTVAFTSGLMVIESEAGLDGLRCVAWRRVGANEMKIDLYNFDSACGATWSGDAALAADGTLELHVDNPGCVVTRCGKCLYDWSFDLSLSVPATQPTPVTITVDTCASQQAATVSSATIGMESQGMHCTLADYGAINEQASAAGTCGKAGLPCVGSLFCGSGSFASTGTCDTGLTCDSSAAVNEPVCFIPCTSDADCPRADAWSCQSGLCRPAG